MKRAAVVCAACLLLSLATAQYGPPPTEGKKHRTTTTTTTEVPWSISNEISGPFPIPDSGSYSFSSASSHARPGTPAPSGGSYWWRGPESPFKPGSQPSGSSAPGDWGNLPGGCGPASPPPPVSGGCGGPAGCTGVGDVSRSPYNQPSGKPVDISNNPFLSSAILGKHISQSPQGCQGAGGNCQYSGGCPGRRQPQPGPGQYPFPVPGQYLSSGKPQPITGQFPSPGQPEPGQGQFPIPGQPQPATGQYPALSRPQPSPGQYPSPGQPQPGPGQFHSPGQPQPGSGQYISPGQFQPEPGQFPSPGQPQPGPGQYPSPGQPQPGPGQFSSPGHSQPGSGQYPSPNPPQPVTGQYPYRGQPQSVPLRPQCSAAGRACVPSSVCVRGVITLNGMKQMRDSQVSEILALVEVSVCSWACEQDENCPKVASHVCRQVKECIPGLEACCRVPPGGPLTSKPDYGTVTFQRPYTGPLNTSPFPGCAAALKCVAESYCTAEGVMSDTPVFLTREQAENKVPLTECQDPDTGIIGKCCRDPNYKDPWPGMMMKNPVY